MEIPAFAAAFAAQLSDEDWHRLMALMAHQSSPNPDDAAAALHSLQYVTPPVSAAWLPPLSSTSAAVAVTPLPTAGTQAPPLSSQSAALAATAAHLVPLSQTDALPIPFLVGHTSSLWH